MDGIRVFLIGNTLLAESLTILLQASGVIMDVERFETLLLAATLIQASPPDVLILADIDTEVFKSDMAFLLIFPDFPVICINSDSNLMKIITTKHITADLNNLFGTISTAKNAPVINGREVI